jgi:chromosomal replication initiation ATPase DnaA
MTVFLTRTARRAIAAAFAGAVLEPQSGATIRRSVDAAVAQVFGVARRDLSVRTRGRQPAARARQVAMYVTHISCGITLTDVGSIFGRDRTTVAHACALVEDRRDDPVFDRVLDLLEWIVRELVTRMGCLRRPTSNEGQ